MNFKRYILKAQLHFFHIMAAIRMDVAPERGLLGFIESLDVKEEKVDTSKVLEAKVYDKFSSTN